MKEVKHLLSKIASARKMIVHETNMVENAEFRLTHIPNDEMWKKIKKEHEEKLRLANEQFDTLYQTFYSLKSYMKQDEWEAALTNLGIVLAETDNINHIRDSLWDEFDLRKAIDETENAIRFTQERMIVADPDTKTILNAQLEYYKNDMKQHYWGECRLETLLSEEAPKR